MRSDDLVPAEEICSLYKVERTFISSLYESGLIEIVTLERKEYVPCDHLRNFEKMMRLHKDLDINIEGLQAIHHLLDQVQKLQKQNVRLKNRLSLYES
ncbi:chaperone modulator CbpM [Autumnicola edwardsiae]|uniref:Chaperone modulator CbpM n=1 Tax=Autumnicola edwardsiae TaxID=3075594 RepID=A0ABU3CSN7_9FLAO|nr:chaperone modulator CbpM [Zunongwangia sp. F297]MDT0649374.1 chaperone modulator CbpM [Zunongwangia sp. F297]